MNTATNGCNIISWEEFVRKYKPLQNNYVRTAPYDGHMFETYGRELLFVSKHSKEYIWTLYDDDSVANGASYANRLGYFVCRIPWQAANTGEINVNTRL